MLYAGSNLGRAQSVFEAAIKHRPRIRLTIRQRTRVLQQWPERVCDEAPRIAAKHRETAELLNAEPRPDANALVHRRLT
jgi:hypothetical protein